MKQARVARVAEKRPQKAVGQPQRALEGLGFMTNL